MCWRYLCWIMEQNGKRCRVHGAAMEAVLLSMSQRTREWNEGKKFITNTTNSLTCVWCGSSTVLSADLNLEVEARVDPNDVDLQASGSVGANHIISNAAWACRIALHPQVSHFFSSTQFLAHFDSLSPWAGLLLALLDPILPLCHSTCLPRQLRFYML